MYLFRPKAVQLDLFRSLQGLPTARHTTVAESAAANTQTGNRSDDSAVSGTSPDRGRRGSRPGER